MKSNKKKEIKDFFEKLKAECLKDDVFSVIETAEKMGVSYDQVRVWARASKAASQILKECRIICWNHSLEEVEKEDELTKKLTTTEAVKYMEENNDEYREQQKKQEAESRMWSLQREAERKGYEFPSDKLERVTVSGVKNEEAKQITPVSKNEFVSEKEALPQQTAEDIEAERINEWVERQKKITPSFYLKKTTTEDETGKKELSIAWERAEKNPLTSERFASSVYAATGSANEQYALKLITQIAMGCFNFSGKEIKVHAADTINESTGVLLSLAPKDEIEGMLCSRLLVLHDQAMQFMSRVSLKDQTCPGIDLNVNRSTKLMRLYNETLETLMRYRRKGEQKVTVQHVNVNNGGQAIVNGQLNQGEGEHDKK
jgi:hypothetical protein